MIIIGIRNQWECLMFVCNCNGINEKSVRKAVSNGASDWREVHAYYGCSPSCGKCECEMKIAIQEERINRESRQNNDTVMALNRTEKDLIGSHPLQNIMELAA